MPAWSIVVPMHRERARIAGTVARLAASPLRDCELLFVDDGSPDDTVAVLQRALATADLPHARVLRLPRNLGKGAAVRTGVLAATRPVVAFVDADLSSPPSAVVQVCEAVEAGAQVVVASRGHATSELVVRQPVGRESAGKSFNRLLRRLGLTDLPDTQCGLKAFDAASARALFGPLRTLRFAFDVEVLLRARRLGLRTEVIPTQWAHVDESRVSPVRDGGRMALDALRLAVTARRERPPRPPAAPMAEDAHRAVEQLAGDHWWFTAKRDWVREQLQQVGGRGLAVDVGCGPGPLLGELRAAGFAAVVGTDAHPSPGVLVADAARLPLPDACADLLCALDVVEHVAGDVAALTEWARVLRPEGLLVLTAPAHRFAWSAHDERLGHHRRYARADLEQAVSAAGLEVAEVRFAHAWLLPVALLLRRTPLAGLVGAQQERASYGPVRNAVGRRLVALDRRVALPFGLSLYLTARRPQVVR